MNTNYLRTSATVLAVLATSLGLPEAGLAQAAAAEQPVMERSRPEVDPQGLRLRSFLLYPAVTVTGSRDDNILADNAAMLDDLVTTLSPSVTFESDWSRHALAFGATANIARYSDHDREDFDDSSFWATTRIGSPQAEVLLDASHSSTHEDRGSPNDSRGIEPTTYAENAVSGSLKIQPNRLSVRVGASFRALEFDNVQGSSGVIVNSDRDRKSERFDLRVAYELQPALDLFLEGRHIESDYDQLVDDDGFQRNSKGDLLLIGAAVDVTGKLSGEFYAGYREHRYDDQRFAATDGAAFGADLTWNLTGLTTISLFADRRIDATTIIGASGTETTEYGLTVDHELRRNVIVSLDLDASKEQFNGIDRQDGVSAAGLTARYLMNRRLQLHAGYTYQDRDSNGISAGRTFRRNILFLSIVGQL